jgi:hypothetical protein
MMMSILDKAVVQPPTHLAAAVVRRVLGCPVQALVQVLIPVALERVTPRGCPQDRLVVVVAVIRAVRAFHRVPARAEHPHKEGLDFRDPAVHRAAVRAVPFAVMTHTRPAVHPALPSIVVIYLRALVGAGAAGAPVQERARHDPIHAIQNLAVSPKSEDPQAPPNSKPSDRMIKNQMTAEMRRVAGQARALAAASAVPLGVLPVD